MKIIAITDIHGRANKVKEILEHLKGEEFDLILIAGDITHFGGKEAAYNILKEFISFEKPFYAVMGNCDGRDTLELLEELNVNLHGKRIEFNGVGITGIGGSNITPFSTIWELSENEIWEILVENYQDGDIVLSHAPPRNTKVDKTFVGTHAGSKSLRKFIEEKHPPLVICGHIHEAMGIDEIGRTLIVNPGPLSRGHYAIIDFDENEKRVKDITLERF
ncbi:MULTISPECIES: YfcE family phosphodiesterase [Thermococcus]|uniref:Phosphoesterase n=2 Tax=Thermococcus sibiricus TaxID=172049 RepID=C6A319_THESM|nr:MULTISPECIES: YfcE family phosphodiesterase [Thermococcus]KUK29379.1 MAG: Metallophosphoesterase, calcineurin superfamily [Thermococcus sp. 40_45]HII66701.1 YfcE family phosphodiesterase [Thermococcaceae archaeon]ACS90014.1 Metallophosphoesterase, calcineurin superfamily [Thermococcus sibiricus MM 739]KUK18611.1 MAG: Metallophosphoesterase, calcineurin superfamily [Thermococcus sibiricus]MBC7095584.1 YfcE family phosphodiesterase [Thermococcus sp.]